LSNILSSTEIGPETLGTLERSLAMEWLLTDDTGSYASSTVIGCNTRRYHGLLVAALRPPSDRSVLLSKVEDELWVGGARYPLSTNEYPGTLFPKGYKHLVGFRQQPFPEFVYCVGGSLLSKTIMMPRGRRTVVIRYRLKGVSQKTTLKVRPLLACRGMDELARGGLRFEVEQGTDPGMIVIRGGTRQVGAYVSASNGTFEERHLQYNRVTYRREAERGFDSEEELFCPGEFTVALEGSKAFDMIVSAAPMSQIDVDAERGRELKRRRVAVELAASRTPLEQALTLAADAFLVRTEEGEGTTVIAGYPWFDSWARDAFLALEGLALVTRRFEDARATLSTFAERITDGMVPNYLATEPNADALNSIDASLWFIHAAYRYLLYTGDDAWTRDEIWPKIRDILAAYTKGTRFGIRADADGLLTGGSRETQLTWMDATVHGRPVTPRHGKAVEVNALWYNALCSAALMAERFAQPSGQYAEQAEKAKASFDKVFWCEESQSLYDCIADEIRDGRLRPNQLLAISLPHAVLQASRWSAVVSAVREHLYTPYGLHPEGARLLQISPACSGTGADGMVWAFEGSRAGDHKRDLRRKRPPHGKRMHRAGVECRRALAHQPSCR